MPVEQRAATRREHDPLGTLRLRLFRPAAALEDLHLGGAANEETQTREHPELDDLDPDRGLRHP